MKHFDSLNILNDSQHGFRKKRSCESQLLTTVHQIARNLSQDSQVDVILLDFAKAFDKVPHLRLLEKLDYYGVRKTTHQWIRTFLHNRQQQVALEGLYSSSRSVDSGVPQGTVLGPLLFLTFINDLPDGVKESTTKLFADDCLLFRPINQLSDSLKLQQDLTALEEWETTWQMSFNPNKCTVLRITNRNKKPLETQYYLRGHCLEVNSSSKYLGITLNQHLTWSEHITNTVSKGNRTVGFLRRNFRNCSTEAKSGTYKTMVRPIIEYASTVWDPSNQTEIKALEQIQRRAARYVCNKYTDRTPGCVTAMINNLGWKELQQRRSENRLSMLFKINNNIIDIDASQFIQRGDSRTRGSQRLYQDRADHPALFNSFPRTTREWNHLPAWLTSTASLEEFQIGLGNRTPYSHESGV